jgi:hypothetical protein
MTIQSRLVPGNMSDNLLLTILLDTTFSMDYIRTFLIQLMEYLLPLINVFPIHLNIICYWDWNSNMQNVIPVMNLGACSNKKQISNIMRELNLIKSKPGIDFAEATSTAVYYAMKNYNWWKKQHPNGDMVIINFTDAPPHNNGIINSGEYQINRERQFLRDKDFPQDWESIAKHLRESNVQYMHIIDFNNIVILPGKNYNSMGGVYTAIYPACLAGVAINLPMRRDDCVDESVIQMLKIVSNLVGTKTPVKHYRIDCDTMEGYTNIDTINKYKKSNPMSADNTNLLLHHIHMNKDILMTKFQTDKSYREMVITVLKTIITARYPDRIMWLLEIPMYLHLYRIAIHERTVEADKIKTEISRVIPKLSSVKAELLNKALTESLDCTIIINNIINKTPSKNVFIFEGVPDKDQRRSILGYIKNFVGKDIKVFTMNMCQITTTSFSDKIANYIPVDITNEDFFCVLVHLIVPGTLLSKRMAAHLAILCVRYSIGLLKERAIMYLTEIKGRWLELDKNICPEYFGAGALCILKNAKNCLTENEWSVLEPYYLLNMLRNRINGTFELPSHWDPNETSFGRAEGSQSELNPRRILYCVLCLKERPLDQMHTATECSHCSGNIVVDRYNLTPEEKQRRREVLCLLYNQSAKQMRRNRKNVWRYPQDRRYTPTQILVEYKCTKCRVTIQVTKCVLATIRSMWPSGLCALCDTVTTESPKKLIKGVFKDLLVNDISRAVGLTCTTKPIHKLIQDTACHTIDWGSLCNVCEPEPITINFKGVPVTIDNLRDSMLNVSHRADCSLCCSNMSLISVKYCDNANCMEAFCSDCLTSWFGKNTSGCVFHFTAICCPFCTKQPSKNWMNNVNQKLNQIKVPRPEPENIYAWCQSCYHVNVLARRECAGNEPHVDNWECNDCVEAKRRVIIDAENARLEAENALLEENERKSILAIAKSHNAQCPKCEAPSIRIDGCNHVQCPVCRIHWCYQCHIDNRSGKGIYHSTIEDFVYRHSRAIHGDIYGSKLRDAIKQPPIEYSVDQYPD